MSLPYNPIAFLDWRADFTSALLLLHDVVTAKRLFDRFRAPCDDLHYSSFACIFRTQVNNC